MALVTLLASQCPLPQYRASHISVVGAGTIANAPVSDRYSAGDSIALLGKLNRNATRQDVTGSFGGGAYFIAEGLTLTAGTGLTVGVGIGTAVIDGPVCAETALTLAVPASAARVWVWLLQTGLLAYTVTVTPPARPACLLGSCATGLTTVTSVDDSGVLRGVGILQRRTADAATPTDTPPSGLHFMTVTAGGAYYWDGLQYRSGGGTGAAGTSLNFRNAYSASASYVPGDIVLAANGALYETLTPVMGTAPPAAPWALFLPAGAAGAPGAAGATGAAGLQGASVYTPRGVWSSLTSYSIADAVYDTTGAYVAVLASQAIGLTDTAHWKQILPPGPTGATGAALFTLRGDYSATTTYAINDIVRAGGGAYLAVAAGTGSVITDTTHWYNLVPAAPAGAAGTTGATGATGSQGPAGAAGASSTFYGTYA